MFIHIQTLRLCNDPCIDSSTNIEPPSGIPASYNIGLHQTSKTQSFSLKPLRRLWGIFLFESFAASKNSSILFYLHSEITPAICLSSI
jgi:hypothetical protein